MEHRTRSMRFVLLKTSARCFGPRQRLLAQTLLAALMFLVCAALALAQGPGHPINPHTGIGWPTGCTSTNPIYNVFTNSCVPQGGTASNPAGPAFCVNFANTSVTNFQCDPNIRIDPTTHMLTLPVLNGAQAQIYNGGALFGSGISTAGTGLGENNAIGVGALASVTTGYFNNLFGTWAGHFITTGSSNVYAGFYSGYNQTTGLYNTCIGGISCGVNPSGTGNTGNGYESLANAGSVTDAAGDRGAPNYNTGIGFETCYWCGYYSYSPFVAAVNTAAGAQSQQNDSDGFANTSYGYQAMYETVAGQSNTAVGNGALLFMDNGSGNTCIGEGCGLNFSSAGADHPGIVVTGISVAGAIGTSCSAGCVVTVTTNGTALNPSGGDQVLLGGTTNWNNGHITTASASSTQFTYAYSGYAFPGEPSGYYDLISNNPQQNTFVGFNTGLGCVTCSYNTIIGADVTGLPASMQGHIILADGHGTRYGEWDGVNNWSWVGQSHGNFNGSTGITSGGAFDPFDWLGPASGGLQMRLGVAGTNIPGAVGTVEGSGCTFLANNAVMTAYAIDNWHQPGAGTASQIMVVCPGQTSTYKANAGTADGNFATFWGSPTWTSTNTSNAGKTTWTLGTTVINANSCTLQTPITVTGLTILSSITWNPSADYTAVTGFSPAGASIYFHAWPTANTINWKACNGSASPITPGSATTWNVGVIF